MTVNTNHINHATVLIQKPMGSTELQTLDLKRLAQLCAEAAKNPLTRIDVTTIVSGEEEVVSCARLALQKDSSLIQLIAQDGTAQLVANWMIDSVAFVCTECEKNKQ